MTFRDWQQLSVSDAADELRRRSQALLGPAQQRAVLAHLPSRSDLEESFAAADRTQPLGGVPYFLKDLFDVAGLPTFAGSTFLPEVSPKPTLDANIVTQLRTAGAVFGGKTHLHEFAYGVTGENPHYGDCEHPHFTGRTTGGSSSGSAAAVAAGIVPFAIGTDTGGSIRVPAAFCGLYGFRLVPLDKFISDAFPLAPTFDTAGWFTSNAFDMVTTLAALVGSDASSRTPSGCYLDLPGLDLDVATACRTAAEKFTSAGDASTRAHFLNGFGRALETYNHIVAKEAWGVHATWANGFRDRYDPSVWERLQRGVTQSYPDYDRALVELAVIRTAWREYFGTYDFLILPATPFGALTKAECTFANRTRILGLTAPASIGGYPVLTIPVPLPSGLTTGLQIVVSHPESSVLNWALNISL